jgi:hypothetical protein
MAGLHDLTVKNIKMLRRKINERRDGVARRYLLSFLKWASAIGSDNKKSLLLCTRGSISSSMLVTDRESQAPDKQSTRPPRITSRKNLRNDRSGFEEGVLIVKNLADASNEKE